mgnify:CR=1 FL=1
MEPSLVYIAEPFTRMSIPCTFLVQEDEEIWRAWPHDKYFVNFINQQEIHGYIVVCPHMLRANDNGLKERFSLWWTHTLLGFYYILELMFP